MIGQFNAGILQKYAGTKPIGPKPIGPKPMQGPGEW
jgi:hypothetical protein